MEVIYKAWRRMCPEEFRAAGGKFGEDRYKCIWHLARICEMAGSGALTERNLMDWRRLAAHHIFYYVTCGFRVYPKHHFFMHFPAQVRCGAPRTFWNYADESKHARFKRLFRVVSKGHAVEQQILLREAWYHKLRVMQKTMEQ